MTEDIVLLETMKALGDVKKVFKLQFAVGEFDMVVYNPEENTCKIYEIKHSDKTSPEQYRHLADAEKCKLTEQKFGSIEEKIVIYSGEDDSDEAANQFAREVVDMEIKEYQRYKNELTM